MNEYQMNTILMAVAAFFASFNKKFIIGNNPYRRISRLFVFVYFAAVIFIPVFLISLLFLLVY